MKENRFGLFSSHMHKTFRFKIEFSDLKKINKNRMLFSESLNRWPLLLPLTHKYILETVALFARMPEIPDGEISQIN